MSATLLTPIACTVSGDDIWRISVERYHQMIASGVITPDDRVELLDGILVSKMPKSPAHRIGTTLLADALRAIVPAGWFIQSEQPVAVDDGEPEPDASVVRGTTRDYPNGHPPAAAVVFVVEVADSSLRRDREWKKRVYARNGIAVYWIVNATDRVIEVFTDPSGPSPTSDYATATTYGPADTIPLVLAGNVVGAIPAAAIIP